MMPSLLIEKICLDLVGRPQLERLDDVLQIGDMICTDTLTFFPARARKINVVLRYLCRFLRKMILDVEISEEETSVRPLNIEIGLIITVALLLLSSSDTKFSAPGTFSDDFHANDKSSDPGEGF